MTKQKKVELNWSGLSFSYVKTDFRFLAKFKNGQWEPGKMTDDNVLHISEGSPALHYGQQCFEGMKAFTARDNRVLVFRPEENARRMMRSARRLIMPPVPMEMFLEGIRKTVQMNMHWVPPYGTGASFYLRPLLIGTGDNIGVRPAEEYIFTVFGIPVGPYFKGGMKPVFFNVSEFDRAAPRGTGAAKVGGNYAASLESHEKSKKDGYADCIYLDPMQHRNIEEVGAANFFGITHDNRFVTPKSDSILPSITKYSLLHIAEKELGMKVEERDVPIDRLDEFSEAGACGTAAVITPIGGIFHNEKMHYFYEEGKEVGPVTRRLYDILTGIQCGDIAGPEGWVMDLTPAD